MVPSRVFIALNYPLGSITSTENYGSGSYVMKELFYIPLSYGTRVTLVVVLRPACEVGNVVTIVFGFNCVSNSILNP